MRRPFGLAIVVTALALPVVASAGSLSDAEPTSIVVAPATVVPPPARNRLQFDLGLGAAAAPGYFGSDELVFGPTGTLRFQELTLFGTSLIDPGADPYGLGLRGSFRYIAERTAEEYPELVGLADLDASLELGGGLAWTQPGYEVFADLRYGVVGHESFVGEVGMDLLLRPSDRLTLSAGPRVLFGDSDYVGTYFGVSEEEAALSTFDAYDPRGGIVTGGLELGAEYAISDDWGVEGIVRYDRYLGDAADSPIVLGGTDDAISAGLVVTRNFSLEF